MNAEYLKQLARELGCLQTIQIRPANSKQCEQIFDYLIVIDFESTCWDGAEKGLKFPEVIEFPAVLMNTKTGDVESEFQQYVMPMENPRLSDFCKKLTGISQDQVDNGVPLASCLRLFSRWINDLSGEKTLIFHKNEASRKSCTFVTWSDWDLSTCLDKECQRKNIAKPEILNQWIDLRAVYRAFYKRMPKGLRGAMSELGLQFEGREHSGLCDARNTARLAYSMMRGGVTLSITKKLQQKSPVKKLRKSITPKKSPARKKILLSSKKSPASTAKVKKSITPKKSPAHKKSLLSSKKSPTSTAKSINQNNLDTPVSTGRLVYQSLQSKNIFAEKENSPSSIKKLRLQHVSKQAVKLNTPMQSVKQKENAFARNATTAENRTPLRVLNLQKGNSNVTPANTRTPQSCKVTPPLCKCGRRAVHRVASLVGPNQGRSFYTCGRRKSLGTVRSNGCGYFKWTSP